VTESFPQIETIVADSAYKTPHMDSTHKEHFRNMVGNRMMQ